MAAKPKYHPETEFRIEPPASTVSVWRIRHKSPDTEGKWRDIKDPDIAIARRLYRTGVADFELTREKLKIILKRHYAYRDATKPKPKFMSGNLLLVDKMWADKYTARRKRRMKRPTKSYTDLKRAAEAAGPMPLDTCDLEALEEYLDATLGGEPAKHARRITWINSILSWLGRPNIQQLEQKARPRVRYLTEPQFLSVLSHLRDDVARRLTRIAFYTGGRQGEIFGVQPNHIRDGYLIIEEQLSDLKDGQGNYLSTSTKTGAIRDALLPDEVAAELREWAAVPMADRAEHRLRRWADEFRAACVAVFPGDEMKHLTFRDIRHCNAIWLLQKGATLHEVAQHLGNHYAVTERFYSGFELKKESIARLRALINPTAKKSSSG